MSQRVDPQNWEANIRFIVNQAIPNDDFQVISYHHSQHSESIYINLLANGRLFQLRYSWHQKADRNPNLASFNLQSFPNDRRLIAITRQFLRDDEAGSYLSYFHFAGLSLVEKLAQVGSSPLQYQAGTFLINGQPVSSHLLFVLDFLWQHQLLLRRFRTGEILLSQSGLDLLDCYWDVAEMHMDEAIWDHNPRIASPKQLINIMAD